jgi:hypothetical protein
MFLQQVPGYNLRSERVGNLLHSLHRNRKHRRGSLVGTRTKVLGKHRRPRSR